MLMYDKYPQNNTGICIYEYCGREKKRDANKKIKDQPKTRYLRQKNSCDNSAD